MNNKTLNKSESIITAKVGEGGGGGTGNGGGDKSSPIDLENQQDEFGSTIAKVGEGGGGGTGNGGGDKA